MVITDTQEGGEKDPRIEFLADFTLKSLRLKSDKWARLLISDEQRTFLSRFIDHTVPQVYFVTLQIRDKCIILTIPHCKSDLSFYLFQELVISQNFSGHLVIHTDWPTPLKTKGVYFVKRDPKPLPKENFLSFMTCGDIHPNSLDHFCAWVEEVSNNLNNIQKI